MKDVRSCPARSLRSTSGDGNALCNEHNVQTAASDAMLVKPIAAGDGFG
jgi:hypothetical protein